MYKWPQGRVIRTIGLVLAIVIAADFGWNGAHAQIEAYKQGANIRPLIVGGIYGLLALSSLIVGLVAIGFKKVSVEFLIDVEQEMLRVTWPTSSELIRATVVIAVMIVVMGVAIFAVDWFNLQVLFKALYGGGK
jgi:preprotein translocase subunit SecE